MADLIARLFPWYDNEHGARRAEQVIQGARGTPRFFEAKNQPEPEECSSRETTASLEDYQTRDDSNSFNEIDSIALTFSDPTFKNSQGIMFGWNSDACDIVVPHLKGISGEHCYITFDHKRRLIVEDKSRNGTIVTYDNLGGINKKKFRWIVGGDCFLHRFVKVIVIQIHVEVKFRIVVPEHDPDRVDDFLARLRELPGLPFGRAGIQDGPNIMANRDLVSGAASSSLPVGPVTTMDSILVRRKVLARGASAHVSHVWDVSNGAQYASKVFVNTAKFNWRGEIERMRRLSHSNIIQMKTCFSEPQPTMLMEYMELGDLRNQYDCEPFSDGELLGILTQSLSALKYLHGQEPQFVHRDIKPDNILVHSRDPTGIYIKLSDFGLSRASDNLRSLCGTARYLAPELFALRANNGEGCYTAAIDIWSLGVTIFEYADQLPTRIDDHYGHYWCEQIVYALSVWEPDDEFDVLNNMLVINPDYRLSATECLDHIQAHQESSESAKSRQSDGSKSGAGTVATKRARSSNPDSLATSSDENRPARRKRKDKTSSRQ